MPATVELGTLLVRLRGDISDLDARLKSAQVKVTDFEKTSTASSEATGRSWRQTGLLVAAATALMVRGLSDAAQSAQDLRAATATTGESVESLSKLEFAAKSVGATLQDVTGAAKGWQQALSDISRGEATEATQAIQDLGVAFQDSSGRFRQFSEVLPEISDALARMPDGFRKTQIASTLLRDDTGKLLTVFGQGSKALEDLAKRQQDLGLIMDREGIEKAARYTAAMGELKSSWEKFGGTLSGAAAGPLKAILDFFNRGAENLDAFLETRGLYRWREAWEANSREIEKINGLIQQELELMDHLSKKNVTKQVLEDMDTVEARIKGYRDTLRALTELQAMFEKVRESLSLEKDAVPIEVPLPTDALKGWFDVRDVIKKDLDDLQDRMKGLPVLFGESFAFDARPFEQAMDRINNAVENGVITEQQAAKMKRQLKKDEQGMILETASLAASTLTTVFGKSKAAAIAAGIINTAVAVTKALSGSVPPYNFIQAALVAAAGVAQIASIRSTTQDGGGSTAPVSSGGSGSSGGGDTGPAPQAQTLFVEGINPNDIFSGSYMKDLAERLLQYQRDGGVVVLT